MEAVLKFLVEHMDLFELLFDAIVNGGTSKEKIKEAIKREMVEASNAQMGATL